MVYVCIFLRVYYSPLTRNQSSFVLYVCVSSIPPSLNPIDHKPIHLYIQAYAAIRGLLGEADAYVRDWLQYQSLWDMSAQAAQDRLGEDLEVCVYVYVCIHIYIKLRAHTHIYILTLPSPGLASPPHGDEGRAGHDRAGRGTAWLWARGQGAGGRLRVGAGEAELEVRRLAAGVPGPFCLYIFICNRYG